MQINKKSAMLSVQEFNLESSLGAARIFKIMDSKLTINKNNNIKSFNMIWKKN